MSVEEIVSEMMEYNLLMLECSLEINSLADELEEAAATFNGDASQIARDLYWDTNVSVSLIADLLNVTKNNVAKTVGPLQAGECKCGRPRMFSSRSKFKQNLPQECECKKEKRKRILSGQYEPIPESKWTTSQYREMPYPDYLNTQHWHVVRSKAKVRAGWKCQLCSATGQLDVHHNTYDNIGCEQDSDVIVLCRTCHSQFHGKAP